MIQLDIQTEDLESVLTFCNSMQLATVCLSLDLYITRVNPIAELLFLHESRHLMDRSLHEICRELGIVAPISSTHTPENTDTLEVSTIHWLADNQFADVNWSVSRCINEGLCEGFLLVGKIMAKHMAKQPLGVEKVIHSLPIAVFSKDLNGYCLSANPYQLHMAGFTHENEMLGKSDYDMPWADNAEVVRSADRLVIKEGKTIVIEEHATLASGEQAVFLVTKAPFKDESGKLLGVAGTAVNISQQKRSLFIPQPVMRINKDAEKVYLTKKEIECVNWMIKGKSSTDIAMLMAISKRTVEDHINNIKQKLNCYKQFQIGYIIGKYGYLFL